MSWHSNSADENIEEKGTGMDQISCTPGKPKTFKEISLGEWFVPIPVMSPLECRGVELYKKVSDREGVRVMPHSIFSYLITFPDNQACWFVT